MKSAHPPITLLNCRECEDILRGLEERPRACACGKSAIRFTKTGFVLSGPCRALTIENEEYDGAAPGEKRTFKVEP